MSDTAASAQLSYVALEDPANPGVFVDVSEKAHNVRMPFTVGDIDSSTFGQGDMSSVKGMRDSTFTIDFYDDPALRDLLWNIYMHNGPVQGRYGPDGDGAGKERYTAKFNMTGWEPGGATNGLNASTANFHRTGGTVRDVFP